MPNNSVQLIFSSPPYNIGKSYETRSPLSNYLEWQKRVLRECERVLAPGGSLCWQVGNYIDNKSGEVIPLDALFWPILHDLGLLSRNRIVWSFEHGLHATRRFSGRHETILWFSKSTDYLFDVDPVRVGQKYPNKRHFKGPKKGELSGNPIGKNPGDVWAIPNVKFNHPEKTDHPCSFPIELAERFVLTMSRPGDIVFDPFGGVGSTVVAAALHSRIGVMAETDDRYIKISEERLSRASAGLLVARPMGKPIHSAGIKA
jgi:adenine-specific DNA-methyltransferase